MCCAKGCACFETSHAVKGKPLQCHPPLPSTVLESLDLRDNQLKSVPALAAFTALRYLELSYNEVGMMMKRSWS